MSEEEELPYFLITAVASLTLSIVLSAVILLQKPSKHILAKLAPPPSQHRLVVQRLLEYLTARETVKGRGLRVILLAVGTRGDVQPCVALATQLIKRGHFPLIVSTKKYKAFWVKKKVLKLQKLCLEETV